MSEEEKELYEILIDNGIKEEDAKEILSQFFNSEKNYTDSEE